jgi:hypothetical protein
LILAPSVYARFLGVTNIGLDSTRWEIQW